jgi:hypothetical protein
MSDSRRAAVYTVDAALRDNWPREDMLTVLAALGLLGAESARSGSIHTTRSRAQRHHRTSKKGAA